VQDYIQSQLSQSHIMMQSNQVLTWSKINGCTDNFKLH